MKNFLRTGFVISTFVAPVVAFATVNDALTTISSIITKATPIVVALALLGFFWGLAVFIFNAGDEKKRASGRSIMIWGIIALFIMLSVFGIIKSLQQTLFNGDTNPQISIPSVNTGV